MAQRLFFNSRTAIAGAIIFVIRENRSVLVYFLIYNLKRKEIWLSTF